MEAPTKVRLTADLPVNEVSTLRQLAERQGISLTEALRRAIATESLLQERRDSGHKVLLKNEQNGNLTEVLFTR